MIKKDYKSKIYASQQKYQNQIRNYQNDTEIYTNHFKFCKELKNTIEELIETKTAYENVITVLAKEMESMSISKDDSIIKNSNKEEKNAIKKKYSWEIKITPNIENLILLKNSKEQINKISTKLKKINSEINISNKKLLETVRILFKKSI